MKKKARKTAKKKANKKEREAEIALKNLARSEQKTQYFAFLLALLHFIFRLGEYALLAFFFAALLTNNWQRVHSLAMLLWGILLIIRPFLQYGREQLTLAISIRLRHRLRTQLLYKLSSSHTTLDAATLTSQILVQVDLLDDYFQRYQIQIKMAVIVPLLILLVVLPLSALSALLFFMTLPLVPLFMILLGKAAKESSLRQIKALHRLGGRFLDFLRGLRTLRLIGAQTEADKMIFQATLAYRDRTMGVLRLAFLSGAVLEFFAALSIALVAVYLGLGLLGLLPWAKGEVPVGYGPALYILLLAPEFYAPLRQLGNDYHAKADAIAAMETLLPLWQEVSSPLGELHRKNPLVPPRITAKNLMVISQKGRARLALDSWLVNSGEAVLIQGSSGAGKSTLLQTLLGLVDYQGEFLIDGLSCRNLARKVWYEQLDYLAQQPHFIRGSWRDNLHLAEPTATDGEMEDVLEQVGLADILAKRGLDTLLDERGGGLSGGQLSRLALARLLLRDRPLWLLDEPTAHLDPESRAEIHQLLERLHRESTARGFTSGGRTLLIVSHSSERLNWVDQRLMLTAVEATND